MGRVVRLLTTNTEEIGRVHAGWVTVFGIVVTVFGIVVIVFGIVACNRCEVTGGAIDAVPQKTITAWGQYIFR